jgi:NAD(P)-dependent dehydrogenase (short-subunit alcohol dehydrogenase family)
VNECSVEREQEMKTFLSIGAGPGMGFATAERFAKEGFHVVLAARSIARTQELAERLVSKGYKADARKVDACDPNGVAELVTEVQKQHGAIDVLHYNAASGRKATLLEQPRDSFNDDLAANIGGALVAAQAVAPKMEEQKSGAILLTGGGFALAPSADFLSISIGKAGIRALAHIRAIPSKRNSRRDCDCIHLRFPGVGSGRIGGRTLLATVQPAEGILDRRSELRPRQRMTDAVRSRSGR